MILSPIAIANCFDKQVEEESIVFSIFEEESNVFFIFGRCENDKPLQPVYKISQDKAQSLGISFISVEVSVSDSVESLKENGILTI